MFPTVAAQFISGPNGGDIEIRIADLFLVLVCLAMAVSLVWLIFRLRVNQNHMTRALAQNEEHLKLLSRACEHSEASERHMAAIETKLDQIHDELKRRPLS